MPANQLAYEDLAPDRRFKARYRMELNVRYRALKNGPALVGIGRTRNVSSGGLLIASQQQIVHVGRRLEVTLDWPSLLHGKTPLQLIAICRVTRCQSAGFAVRLERYHFRARKP